MQRVPNDETPGCAATDACAAGEANGSRHGNTARTELLATWAKMSHNMSPSDGQAPKKSHQKAFRLCMLRPGCQPDRAWWLRTLAKTTHEMRPSH